MEHGTSATMNVHEKCLPLKLKFTFLVPKDRMGEPLAATKGGPRVPLALSDGVGTVRLTSAPESTRKRQLEVLSRR